MKKASINYFILFLFFINANTTFGEIQRATAPDELRRSVALESELRLVTTATTTNNTNTCIAWKKSEVSASDIGNGSKGSKWIADTISATFGFKNNVWQKMPGGASHIAVDSAGAAWVVNDGGQIYKFDLIINAWKMVPGLAKDIAVAANGNVWAVGMLDEIFRCTGIAFTKMPGAAVWIAADKEGKARVVNTLGQIFKHNGTGYDLMPGLAKKTGIEENKIWIAGSDGYAWCWYNGSWICYGGDGLQNILVENTGMPWGITFRNSLYQSVLSTPILKEDGRYYAADSLIREASNTQTSTTSTQSTKTNTIAITSAAPTTTLPNQNITICPGGAYMACFEVQYKNVSGQLENYNSADVAAGWKYNLSLPEVFADLTIKSWNYTGLVWEPKKSIINQTYALRKTMCVKTYNTTQDPKWNNEFN